MIAFLLLLYLERICESSAKLLLLFLDEFGLFGGQRAHVDVVASIGVSNEVCWHWLRDCGAIVMIWIGE